MASLLQHTATGETTRTLRDHTDIPVTQHVGPVGLEFYVAAARYRLFKDGFSAVVPMLDWMPLSEKLGVLGEYLRCN